MNRAYLAAIEHAFLAHAGRGLMLSAADVELVRQWARAGIPVEAVLTALETCFSRPGLDRTRVRGLAFVRREVEAEAALRRSLNTGAVVAVATPEPGQLLERLVLRLQPVLGKSPSGRTAIETLRALGPGATEDEIWARWAVLRVELVEAAWNGLDAPERDRMGAEVTAGLVAEQRRTDPAHFAETWRAHRDLAIARRLGLPDDLELYALGAGT